MKIIYHCYGGTHSSVTAAGIHLGLLPKDRLPSPQDLLNLNYFDRRNDNEIGKIIKMGTDYLGNEIYAVGRRNRPNLLYNVVDGMTWLLNIEPNNIMTVDVSSYVNSSMRTGGFISRRIGLIKLGRPIVTWGTLRNYNRLVAMVEKVYSAIK